MKKVIMIENGEWDHLVRKTYNKIYTFQQQDGCQSRGSFKLTIPCKFAEEIEEDMNETIPEEVNGEQMGVKFDTWLNRDINEPVGDDSNSLAIELFWERNFYPSIYTVANDLYKRGLIEAGDYIINIDW